MNSDRLQVLMAVHSEFVRSAGLPEGTRPYGIKSNLDAIEELMMEEINKQNLKPTNSDDNIPF